MAIAKTGAMFKTLTFDNQSSRNYGVYITGEAVYNAPNRDVEMITIPGRNGAFAKDNGRFENIEVTYPAGIAADNEQDFTKAISDFRNMLCSRKGYCRLTDDYNSDEYRMAVYKSGLEVSPALLRAGEFEITFECKPQRFLTSGETAKSVASGGTITNPTLFDSSPFISFKGTGDITINGYPIKVRSAALGDILLLTPQTEVTSISFDSSMVGNGDTITLLSMENLILAPSFAPKRIVMTTSGIPTINKSNADVDRANEYTYTLGASTPGATCKAYNISFTAGTAGYIEITETKTYNFDDSTTGSVTYKHKIQYDGSETISFDQWVDGVAQYTTTNTSELRANSSLFLTNNICYLDCDIGEAYKIVNGETISVDNAITMGAELPVLSSGSNLITYSASINTFKITPRWWKI